MFVDAVQKVAVLLLGGDAATRFLGIRPRGWDCGARGTAPSRRFAALIWFDSPLVGACLAVGWLALGEYMAPGVVRHPQCPDVFHDSAAWRRWLQIAATATGTTIQTYNSRVYRTWPCLAPTLPPLTRYSGTSASGQAFFVTQASNTYPERQCLLTPRPCLRVERYGVGDSNEGLGGASWWKVDGFSEQSLGS